MTNAVDSKRARVGAEDGNFSNLERFTFLSLDRRSPHFDRIEDCFNHQIAALYGDQSRMISRLKDGEDRKCELLLDRQSPAGFVVYKTANQPNFSHYGVEDSFEIKNIHLFDPSREDQMDLLCNRVILLARRQFAKNVHVLVTDCDKTALNYYQKKGFKVAHTWNDSALAGVKEHLLSLELIPTMTQSLQESHRSKRERDQSSSYEPISFGIRERGASHEITLKQKYITQIRSGLKTVEGRIYNGVILRYRAGDLIRFHNGHDEVSCRIIKVERHSDFKEMLQSCGVNKCLADLTRLEDGVRVYNDIPGYSERARQHGVAAIHLELLSEAK